MFGNYNLLAFNNVYLSVTYSLIFGATLIIYLILMKSWTPIKIIGAIIYSVECILGITWTLLAYNAPDVLTKYVGVMDAGIYINLVINSVALLLTIIWLCRRTPAPPASTPTIAI